MSNVLFTHSYFMKFDPKQWGLQQSFPPLGTLYSAALLREKGHRVTLFDVMFSDNPDEIIPVLERESPDILVICDDGFNYLTKMCLTNMRDAAFKMIEFAHKTGCIVVVSSSDSTDHFSEYLNKGADFIILGETEATLEELVQNISAGEKDFSGIKGLAFLKNKQVVETNRRESIRNLDLLPFPAWDLVDMNAYRKMWLDRYGYFTINLATTRGCPFKCTWCAKPIYGYRYNSHSPEYIIRQLLHLKNNFGYDKVWFCDDIFGLDKKWVHSFEKAVLAAQLKFKYKIQSRADLLLDEEYLSSLADSGCETVWLGAESGSQKILDSMQKNVKVEQIYTATRLLKKHGLKPAFFIQFGYLDETWEDIKLTIKMINDLLPEDIGISVSYPLPGTIFHDIVKDQLKEKTNWTDSDELALMYKNTYPSVFYKALHRFVHKNYRKHQGFSCIRKILLNPFSASFTDFKRALLVLYYIPAAILSKRKLNIRADG